jgi:hypothetical protein
VLQLLVEQGEQLEKQGLGPMGLAKSATGAFDRVATGAMELLDQVQDAFDARFAAALHRELAASIDALRVRR